MKGILIILLLILGTTTQTLRFRDIGIGQIEIEPLSTKTIQTKFFVDMQGYTKVAINILGEGSLQISVKINNISVTVRINEKKEIYVWINKTVLLELTVINYGMTLGRIYENSTLIFTLSSEQESKNASPLLFVLVIVVPLVALYLYEKKKPVSVQQDREEVIII